jgi:hypothetical protein
MDVAREHVTIASRPSYQSRCGGIACRASSRNSAANAATSARSWASMKRRSTDRMAVEQDQQDAEGAGGRAGTGGGWTTDLAVGGSNPSRRARSPRSAAWGCLLTSSSWSPPTVRSCCVPIVPMSHAEWVAGSLGRWWIESTFDTLKTSLAWNATAAAPCPEWWSGVAQRLALGVAIWWNWEAGTPGKRSLVAYDHWDLIHLLADQLGEVEGVTRVDMPGRPSLLLFEVRRRGRGRCWWSGSSATLPRGGRAAGGVRLAVAWARRRCGDALRRRRRLLLAGR